MLMIYWASFSNLTHELWRLPTPSHDPLHTHADDDTVYTHDGHMEQLKIDKTINIYLPDISLTEVSSD